MDYQFHQVDVFTAEPLKGNPLAVVAGADDLTDAKMEAFANWTNLSETTFLLQPTTTEADYRVRIFTPTRELPFAGHPTLGSCHTWLSLGNAPAKTEIIQECAAGLIRIRRDGNRLSFAAPPLLRSGPVDDDVLAQAIRGLNIGRDRIVDANWVDNGPGWLAILLPSVEDVLALRPDFAALGGLKLGVVAPRLKKAETNDIDFEVRAFMASGLEDPVTGSLNAGIAQWLIGSGIAPSKYLAGQGTALGRAGKVHIEKIGDDIWVGGDIVTCIKGNVTL